MSSHDALRDLFAENGQAHIFAGWDKLTPDEQADLAADCAKVDFAWLNARRNEYTAAANGGRPSPAGKLEPATIDELPRDAAGAASRRSAREKGEELIRAGKTAAFLVAGGQGSRLGFDGPKGCYPLGPISGKTLFEWHAEQIRARSRRYGVSLPWYIMTSRDNVDDTRRYFEASAFLGLPKDDVFFFVQDMVPTIDRDGNLFLASASRLAMNPNGHGGAMCGLVNSGATADMKRRGVEYVTSFQVDNPLATICDPEFIGAHVLAGAEMSSKVLKKVGAEEKIGSVGVMNGKTVVVEYSDLDAADMHATTPDGRLVFWAGSIGLHALNVDFIDRVGCGDNLPWHQAIKSVAHFDGARVVKPKDKNAVKFETFIFDALPLASGSINFEVRREHEFAPVKNAVGVDSAESCRELLTGYFGEWLTACGVDMPAAAEVEISPLYSLDADELKTKVRPGGLTIETRLLLA